MSAQSDVAVLFDRLCKAWTTNDGAELGALFTDDGTLINPFGQRADGRDEVTAMYGEYFGGLLRGTAATFDIETVRSITDTDALVDGRQPITAPDGAVVLDVHVTALVRRVDGDWRFVDVRPYAFAQPPA
ncbi:MAG TPA: SgcJ/EcaC family oxidoreductase [Mycobacteriales bacterium]|nr:SgcJ/EcaC family oxidoreductase [Mycobacteriales bacterium]